MNWWVILNLISYPFESDSIAQAPEGSSGGCSPGAARPGRRSYSDTSLEFTSINESPINNQLEWLSWVLYEPVGEKEEEQEQEEEELNSLVNRLLPREAGKKDLWKRP